MKIWKKWKYGNMEIWKNRKFEIQKYGNMEILKIEIWKHGNMGIGCTPRILGHPF